MSDLSWHTRESREWTKLPLSVCMPSSDKSTLQDRVVTHIMTVDQGRDAEPLHLLLGEDTYPISPMSFMPLRKTGQLGNSELYTLTPFMEDLPNCVHTAGHSIDCVDNMEKPITTSRLLCS